MFIVCRLGNESHTCLGSTRCIRELATMHEDLNLRHRFHMGKEGMDSCILLSDHTSAETHIPLSPCIHIHNLKKKENHVFKKWIGWTSYGRPSLSHQHLEALTLKPLWTRVVRPFPKAVHLELPVKGRRETGRCWPFRVSHWTWALFYPIS